MGNKQVKDWTPRPGELVQIWDHHYQNGSEPNSDDNIGCIDGHGQVGYIVKIINLKTRGAVGPSDFCCEVICFGKDPKSERVRVHADWLVPLRDPSDIRKIEINL
ncbi:MAG: hypothetical protein CMF52_06935 [Legionellales bacterium]|nr:hypothetical protein [Legionellales bacterium]|tara:strand:+ start:3074 stop:3388 length:315 start_codon:yes stop_codon:yes gene_type:complete